MANLTHKEHSAEELQEVREDMGMAGDQSDGMIRDSDIKFQVRLLINALVRLKVANEQSILEPLMKIVKLENERLDKLR